MQGDATFDPLGGHTIWQVIVIVFLTGSLSLVTVVGNILVLVSFKINKALKTVNNYYLLSLAFADLTIGTLSMNLYTTYIIMSQWALGPVICDLWLAIDYVASNASVMNLLVISFDRYFSVTRPLTYRAKRTTKRAMTMICLAWSTSFILWAPAILFWQYIVGERTVPDNECFIQFLSEPIITFCTAIAAFYLPVTVMTTLFWKIYQETEKRAKDIQGLKGSGAGNSQSQNHRSGDSVNKSQKEKSETSTQQMNDGNDEQNQLPSENDKDNSNEKKTKRPKENNSELNNSQPGDPSPENTSLKEGATVKKFAAKAKTEVNKRKNEKKANDKKAAKTLSAILLAFITTWLPYNIMVLVNTFCEDCIPGTLWALGYWLCYVNSTINPMCYALCNKTFRNTFKSILMCQWNQNKSKPQFNKRNPAACRK
nr:muscarinic acetylcholine receptor M3-like [Nerophis lumbriciformis]